MIRIFLSLLAALVATSAMAQTPQCRTISYADNRYTLCEIDLTSADVRLFLNDQNGTLLGQFSVIDDMLRSEGKKLSFGMNAGMYHDDRDPVGYYVEAGTEHMRIVENAGPGNFGLLPNGVFCIRPGRADVIETLAFVQQTPDCIYASQSGPMLVIAGELHPRFLIDSTSRYIRNGVGTSADGKRAVFVISDNTVTFHEFGSLFRDGLNLPNALYFDGNISRMHSEALGRSDLGFQMGPVVGVVEDRAN